MSDTAINSNNPLAWLVAHRGWPGRYPENSLTGMEAVLEAGARYVEFDVQLSGDGQPMVIHDDKLERLTGFKGKVGELDQDALRALTVAGPEGRLDRLPTLEEMLTLLARWPEVTVFIELKRASMRRFGRPALIDPVLAAVSSLPNPVVIISFDSEAVEMARSRADVAIGWVFKPWTDQARADAARLAPEYLFVRADRVPEGLQPFWPGDWRWVVYGVEDRSTASGLLERGADLIETDGLPEMVAAWEADTGAMND